MKTEVLKGKQVADEVRERIRQKIDEKKENNRPFGLAVLRVGNDESDLSYERSLKKNCDKLGIPMKSCALPKTATTADVVRELERLNEDPETTGILVFRPLPKQIDSAQVRLAILPEKDVDAMHPLSLAKIMEGDFSAHLPATPAAVRAFLHHYEIDVRGKTIAIVNRSLVFGRPLAMILLEDDACPQILHSKTEDLRGVLKRADIVVLATGRAKMFDRSYFTNESIVLDVGVSVDENGTLCGDADFEALDGYVKMITPPKGGIGSATTALLLEQVVGK